MRDLKPFLSGIINFLFYPIKQKNTEKKFKVHFTISFISTQFSMTHTHKSFKLLYNEGKVFSKDDVVVAFFLFIHLQVQENLEHF